MEEAYHIGKEMIRREEVLDRIEDMKAASYCYTAMTKMNVTHVLFFDLMDLED